MAILPPIMPPPMPCTGSTITAAVRVVTAAAIAAEASAYVQAIMAGLLPILKQLVEILFGRGLMEVVFATDTLALDVHVISDLRKQLRDMRCTATLRWPGGSHQWTWQGDVPPDSCVRVGIVQFVVPEVQGELWLDLTLEHPAVAATNRYTTTTGEAQRV